MAMFQGTVIDAETIYLGMKIEEWFETLAKAVGGSETAIQLMSAGMKERPTPRQSIGALRDQLQTDSAEVRAEIRGLKVALCQALALKMPREKPIVETPNDLAKETV